jgi:hypothetical protein
MDDNQEHHPLSRWVDPMEEGISENLRLGYIELVGVGEDGEVRYRLTPKGEARVKTLIEPGDSDE